MTVLLTLLTFCVLLIVGIALIRIRVIIDTDRDRYELRMIPIGGAELLFDEGTIGYRWHAPFLQREGRLFPPMDTKGSVVQKEGRIQRRREKKRRGSHRSTPMDTMRLVRRVLQSFRVRHFLLRINTGSAAWNAWLVPVMALWRARGNDVAVRFVGASSLHLDIENSIHRLAGVFIRSYLLKPKRR